MKSAFGIEHGHGTVSKMRPVSAQRLSGLGGKFGRMPKREYLGSGHESQALVTASILGGAAGGGVLGHQLHRKENKGLIKQVRSNRGQLAANTRAKNKYINDTLKDINKSRSIVYRITDVGTRAQKLGGELPPPKWRKVGVATKKASLAFGGGTAVASGASAAAVQHKARPRLKAEISRQKKRLDGQRQELRALGVKR